jgi:hypothetical protein
MYSEDHFYALGITQLAYRRGRGHSVRILEGLTDPNRDAPALPN